MKENVAIIGCGTVGTALGKLLGKAGYPIVGVCTTRAQEAARIAERLGALHASAAPWEVTRDADLIFITTPDDAIRNTCDTLASKDAFPSGSVVIHCSGAHPSTLLASARNRGASIVSLHPLQTFASAEQAEVLVPGSYFAAEGDQAAIPVARRLVNDLHGIWLEISPTLKPLYHAAAVAASNYLVTLLDMSLQFNRMAGIPAPSAFKALSPLIHGTLRNIDEQGIPQALTGPIARGDVETVAGHVASIREHMPRFLPMYRSLGMHAVDLSLERGTISEETATRLRTVLEPH